MGLKLVVCVVLFNALGSLASKVTLYDAVTESEFCKWKIQKQLESGKRQAFTRNNTSCNKICGVGNTKWFVSSPRIATDKANSLNMVFDLLLDYRIRNPRLILLDAQTATGQPFQYDYGKFYSTKLSDYETTIAKGVPKTNNFLNIELSMPDLITPECLTISRVTVYYNKCAAVRKGMAIFPDVIASGGDTYAVGKGKCMDNTVPIYSKGPLLYCDKNGSVVRVDGCECKAGFEKVSNSCKVCADGMYKAKRGNQGCSSCGKGSISSRDGTSCPCLSGSRESMGKTSYSDDCKSMNKHKEVVILIALLSVVSLAFIIVSLLACHFWRKRHRRGERRPLLNQAQGQAGGRRQGGGQAGGQADGQAGGRGRGGGQAGGQADGQAGGRGQEGGQAGGQGDGQGQARGQEDGQAGGQGLGDGQRDGQAGAQAGGQAGEQGDRQGQEHALEQ